MILVTICGHYLRCYATRTVDAKYGSSLSILFYLFPLLGNMAL